MKEGTIYLLHFKQPFGHARHYLGWTTDLMGRMADHWEGAGARLLHHVRNAGIEWVLVATWRGPRREERRMKNRGSSVRHCPICRGEYLRKRKLARALTAVITVPITEQEHVVVGVAPGMQPTTPNC